MSGKSLWSRSIGSVPVPPLLRPPHPRPGKSSLLFKDFFNTATLCFRRRRALNHPVRTRSGHWDSVDSWSNSPSIFSVSQMTSYSVQGGPFLFIPPPRPDAAVGPPRQPGRHRPSRPRDQHEKSVHKQLYVLKEGENSASPPNFPSLRSFLFGQFGISEELYQFSFGTNDNGERETFPQPTFSPLLHIFLRPHSSSRYKVFELRKRNLYICRVAQKWLSLLSWWTADACVQGLIGRDDVVTFEEAQPTSQTSASQRRKGEPANARPYLRV